MKLNKEEIQKLSLSCLLGAALIYGYFSMMLAPLSRSQDAMAKQIEELEPKVEAANRQILKTRNLESRAAEVSEKLARIGSLIPVGSPIAWFPPRIVDFFQRQGVEHPTVRLVGDGEALNLEAYKRLQWNVDLPVIGFNQLGIALAALENEEPLLRTLRIQIDTNSDDAERQHVVLVVSNIVRK